MMTKIAVSGKAKGLGVTDRRDLWWVGPLSVFLGLSLFVIYATFRVFYNAHYVVDTPSSAYLLSPFYSPLIIWDGMPSWLSPAILVLWAPGGFRLTCYYYRKAYYRAFFLDPPACAVSELPKKKYRGETGLLLLQNIHRYFLYLSLFFLVILTIDVIYACMWPNGFGISVGTLVLLSNVVLLGLYTFSCHSLRHLVGGKFDCYSCVAFGHARHKLWKGVSKLNSNHMYWAWTSLFMVAFADFYIWMVNIGVFTDLRIF
jgi:hypothetical protein